MEFGSGPPACGRDQQIEAALLQISLNPTPLIFISLISTTLNWLKKVLTCNMKKGQHCPQSLSLLLFVNVMILLIKAVCEVYEVFNRHLHHRMYIGIFSLCTWTEEKKSLKSSLSIM